MRWLFLLVAVVLIGCGDEPDVECDADKAYEVALEEVERRNSDETGYSGQAHLCDQGDYDTVCWWEVGDLDEETCWQRPVCVPIWADKVEALKAERCS